MANFKANEIKSEVKKNLFNKIEKINVTNYYIKSQVKDHGFDFFYDDAMNAGATISEALDNVIEKISGNILCDIYGE